jgi:hypothetical protein
VDRHSQASPNNQQSPEATGGADRAEAEAAIALVGRLRTLGCRPDLFDTGPEHAWGRLRITPPVGLPRAEWTRLEDEVATNTWGPGYVLYLSQEGAL